MAGIPGLSLVQGDGVARLHVLDQPGQPQERADAARNRKRILDAARKLLGRRPIQDICMDELAHAAGVGKGTLYRRFTDRSSLCHALLDDAERTLQDRVIHGFSLPPGAPALEGLGALLDALFDFVQDNAALLSEALAFHRDPHQRFDSPPYRWRHAEVTRLLERGVREGTLAPMPAEAVAHLVLGTLDPGLVLFQRAHGVTEETQRDAFRRHWRTGVLGP